MKKVFLVLFILLNCVVFAQNNEAEYYLQQAQKLQTENNIQEALKNYIHYINLTKDVNVFYVSALKEAGSLCLDLGDFDSAACLLDKGIECAKKINSDTLLARLYIKRSDAYSADNKFDLALNCAEMAFDIAERTGNLSIKSVALEQKGCTYFLSGNNSNALSFLEKALIISKKLNDKRLIAEQLNNLGAVAEGMSKFDVALKYFEDALDLEIELKNENDVGTLYGNIGIIYQKWGEDEKAADYFEKALAISKKSGQEEIIASSINNLGTVYEAMFQFDKALKNYEEALALAQKIGSNEIIPSALCNISHIYSILGNRKKSFEYSNRALEFDIARGKKDNICTDYCNMGFDFMKLGQHDKALEYFNKAVSVLGKDTIGVRFADVLQNIGENYSFMHNFKQAIYYQTGALQIYENIRRKAKGAARRAYLSKQIVSYQALISYYIADKKPYEALDVMEHSTARYLGEQIKTRTGDTLTTVDIRKYQENLNKNTAVLCFNDEDFNYELPAFVLKRDTLFACKKKSADLMSLIDSATSDFVNKYSKENEFEKKRNARNLNRILSVYKRIISLPSPGIGEIRLQRHLGRILYDFLIKDFEPLFKDVNEIAIITGSSFSSVPFETFINPKDKYLVEGYDIKYLPSLTVSDLIDKRNYDNNRKYAIAFGGAVYDSLTYNTASIEPDQYLRGVKSKLLRSIENNEKMQESYAAMGFGKMPNLPASYEEVNNINKINNDCRVITGKEVNESVVKNLSKSGELAGFKVIHFATHAIVIPQVPELSALVLSQTNEEGNEDGFLRLQEIADLKLKADFVCLSACKTGLGRVYNGEGVVGLTQSFFIAGANGISVSLWEVEDRSTMDFMTGMYKLVKEKSYSYSKALNEMKRSFIKSSNYASPFNWAPFVYWGK